MSNILKEICEEKRSNVKENKTLFSEASLLEKIKSCGAPRGFLDALVNAINSETFALITEIKKASPSRGVIREKFEVENLANDYTAGGATCLSVLTDTKYFQGKDEHLELAKKGNNLPILRKDFIIDPYQVIEARSIGADCILLIMAAITDNLALEIYDCGKKLGMDVLVEVHDEDELFRATRLNPDLLGINNRDLKTLKVDISTTEKLAKYAPKNATLVSESGLYSHSDLVRISQVGVKCFLVGESLMRQDDVSLGVRLLLGK